MEMDNSPLGTIPYAHFQSVYWTFVGSAIAAATVVNGAYKLQAWSRHRAASQGKLTPAKPSLLFAKALSIATSCSRLITYCTFPAISWRGHTFHTPTFGALLLIAANFIILIVLPFWHISDTTDVNSFEFIGYRLGFLNICQMPLLFLLAQKVNVVGYLTGLSYEKLNWLHRWTARTLFFTVTMHGAYWIADWAPNDYVGFMVHTDSITQKGIAAWSVLAWINLSSLLPIRRLSHEIFVVQHVASFIALIVIVYFHTPAQVHKWLWFTIAVVAFDWFMRCICVMYRNLGVLHPKARNGSGLLTCKATLSPMPGDVTKVTVANPPMSWKPGQHVRLACHSLALFQRHPFTIASIPSDGKLSFVVKAEKGATRLLHNTASEAGKNVAVVVDGPYGSMRPLTQFDTVVLLAGSTGATFTMPQLLDMIFKKRTSAVTRRIRFIWAVKSFDQTRWFSQELSRAMERVREIQAAGIEFDVQVYIHVTGQNVHDSQSWHDAASSSSEREDLEKGLAKREAGTAAEILENAPVSPLQATSEKASDFAVPEQRSVCSQEPSHTDLHPNIKLSHGRPEARTAIFNGLENAQGESAVVVCGPTSLVNDVRRSTVAFTARHAMDSAAGVYLHTEAFSY